jgi:glycine cleavage system H protein
MEPTHVASVYQAKAIEYLIAVTYLILFVPFWQYVQGRPARRKAPARVKQPGGAFHVPDGLMLHPGHGWAAAQADGVAIVGIDDFARRMLGTISNVELPAPGAHITQGAPGWTLETAGERVDMAAPVDGVVVAVNQRVLREPGLVSRDPYGEGWLLKVAVPEMERSARQLIAGAPARHWIDGVFEQLRERLSPELGLVLQDGGQRERLSPELGLVLQDGGQPVDGIAREADPKNWVALARQFLASPVVPAVQIKREEWQ